MITNIATAHAKPGSNHQKAGEKSCLRLVSGVNVLLVLFCAQKVISL